MMDEKIPQPAFFMFKCQQSAPPGMPKPACVNEQTQELFQYMAGKLMEKGITQTVQPVQTSCLNRCSMGPVMLIEPGHHMYVNLDKEKIDKIIQDHIIGGTPVEEYIIDENLWADPVAPKDLAR
ncbi:MAG: (2Fe-2S) ferredoxin domain-containing protein [Campylobacterota bacterium]